MISTTNRIASDRNVTVWVVPETVPGTIEYPEAEHIIAAFDITYPTQNPEYSNSKERAQTRDVMNRCQGPMPAGEWGFSTSCRPKGIATPPQERNLLTGLAGVESVGATDVIYSLQIEKPSYTLWFLVDHTMLFCIGATVGTCEFNLEECALEYQWSGGFMAMGVTGTEVLSGDAVAGLKSLPIANTDKYSVMSKVVLADSFGNVSDDNGGAGYTVETIVDNTSLELTEVLAVGQVAGGFVAPFDPGGTVGGNPLETRTAIVDIGGTEKPVVNFTWTVTDEPEYLTREKTPSGYPVSYAETQREVGGEIVLAFRRDDADEFKKAIRGDEQAIKITVGDLDGYIVEINMPRTKAEVPTTEESEPIVEITIPFTAIATTGEDSYTVTYT